MTTIIVPKPRWQEFKRIVLQNGFPDVSSAIHDDTAGTVTVTWDTDLTAGQLATAQGAVSHLNAGISAAEYNIIKPDLAALKTYMTNNSPTAAQTAVATKSIIRVLRALIRD